ncbi:hypothetical protein [Catenulispora pinisilvae]|uniref:hypothetical protein n=1 Tax=Catenulispora pinisilvae TaxID=2705253 RepID=UPI00189200F1|nr:hypothetical protein [Catenulispora pinisilvae]
MEHDEEAEFRRMEATAQIERAEELIVQYETGIAFYRKYIDYRQRLIGHIAGRLGEPEPEEGDA